MLTNTPQHYNRFDLLPTSTDIKEDNSILPETRERTNVRIYTRFCLSTYFFVLENVYPEITKYAITNHEQPVDKSKYKLHLHFTNNFTPYIFYLPYDITFRYFLEDSGLDTDAYYYVSNYLIPTGDDSLTIEVLKNVGLLVDDAKVMVLKKKKWNTKYDWKTIPQTEIEIGSTRFW